MVEILLIVLCVIAAGRFRAAGEKGVGKYIGGVWGCVLGGAVLGGFIGGMSESVVVIYVIMGIGYIAAICIAVSAMKTGKGYIAYNEQKKTKEKSEKEKLEGELRALQQKVAAMEAGGVKEAESSNFEVLVENVIPKLGRGTYAIGLVKGGNISLGATAFLLKANEQARQTRINGITDDIVSLSGNRNSANVGDKVALLLLGISESDVSKGDVLSEKHEPRFKLIPSRITLAAQNKTEKEKLEGELRALQQKVDAKIAGIEADGAHITELIKAYSTYVSLSFDETELNEMERKLLNEGERAGELIFSFLLKCSSGELGNLRWWYQAAGLVRMLKKFKNPYLKYQLEQLVANKSKTNVWEYHTQIAAVAEEELKLLE